MSQKQFVVVSDGDYGGVYSNTSGRKVFEGDITEIEEWITEQVASRAEIQGYFEDVDGGVPNSLDEALTLQLGEDR